MPNHPYKKLKQDYEHLLDRTWGLFKLGLEKEDKLKTAVANAWKQFERIEESNDIEEIRSMATKAKEFMLANLEESKETT